MCGPTLEFATFFSKAFVWQCSRFFWRKTILKQVNYVAMLTNGCSPPSTVEIISPSLQFILTSVLSRTLGKLRIHGVVWNRIARTTRIEKVSYDRTSIRLHRKSPSFCFFYSCMAKCATKKYGSLRDISCTTGHADKCERMSELKTRSTCVLEYTRAREG